MGRDCEFRFLESLRTPSWHEYLGQTEAGHVLAIFRIRIAGTHLLGRATVGKACRRERNCDQARDPDAFFVEDSEKAKCEEVSPIFQRGARRIRVGSSCPDHPYLGSIRRWNGWRPAGTVRAWMGQV